MHKIATDHPRTGTALPVQPMVVHIAFTRLRATVRALREAVRLSQQLSSHICLLIPVIVQYPAPLCSQWGRVEAAKRNGRRIGLSTGISMEVHILVCRDPLPAYAHVLPPRSILLLGGPRRWWRSREQRTARDLTALGLNAIFIGPEVSHA